MKTLKISGLIISLMIVSNSFGQTGSSEQLTVPLSNPGKPYTLKADIVSGSINVSGYDGKEIIINATLVNDDGEKSEPAVNGMKRIPKSAFEITAKELDNSVTVNTGNPAKAIKLDLKIPQDVKLKLSTVNDGDIEVENVKGELEVNNVNGKIILTNISGSVVANTVNGDVTVTFSAVDPKAPMAFSTLNGNVNVTLPSDTRANLKLKSDNGEIYSDFDIDIDKTQPKVSKSSEPGMYRIRKDDWVYGKINGGGPELLMKNLQGNLYVKKSVR